MQLSDEQDEPVGSLLDEELCDDPAIGPSDELLDEDSEDGSNGDELLDDDSEDGSNGDELLDDDSEDGSNGDELLDEDSEDGSKC